MKASAGLPGILACASLLLIGCGGVVRQTVPPVAAPAAQYAAPVQHAQPVQEGTTTSTPVRAAQVDGHGVEQKATPATDPSASGASAATTQTGAQTRTADPGASGPQRGSAEDFVPTRELYDKTFGEVEDVVESLNRIIAADDYTRWLTYLTPEYISVTGDPAFLAEASKSPVLLAKGTKLNTLRDYFDAVVVRSRTKVRLDSLSFIDEQHVKALTKMGNSVVILYYLVRDDDSWKVGMWQNAKDQ